MEMKNLAENVMDQMREGEPPVHELSEEEKADLAKKAILKKDIIRRAQEYIKVPVEDRKEKKYLLAEIQQIVDEVDDAFVLMVNDAKGIPTCITFNPRTPEPEDPTIST